MTNLSEKHIEVALRQGAKRATVVKVADIVFRREFRDACKQNRCGKYSKCWMCPPDVGEIDAMIAHAKTFSYALIYQSVGQLEDSFDIVGMQEAAKFHKNLTLKIAIQLEDILEDALKLTAGGCHICERCARIDNQPCFYPSKAMTSLEAYGISVSELASICEMNYVNGANTVTYFGAVLFNI